VSLRARLLTWALASETVRRWRERRYELFVALCDVRPGERILDVGAGFGAALERFNTTNEIVAVDLEPYEAGWLTGANVDVRYADATRLPFRDREFPLAFSSSVLEHIPRERQAAFAAEIHRVADRYFVQTPNRFFPLEPHYQLPFFQLLPRRAQRWLVASFALGWHERGEWEEITLLSAAGLARLFPEAEIHRERVLGLTKSLMAVRR
jgi:SAM-dependent methyltransferase